MTNIKVPNVKLKIFIDFLLEKGYEIIQKNPKHIPGEGYSPPEYYSNVDIEFALKHFETFLKTNGKRETGTSLP
jgi:hypothetical protein